MRRLISIMKLGSFKVSSLINLSTYVMTVAISLATYRIMISVTSISIVGCWALIQGLSAVSRIADFGLGTNLTRFVASFEHHTKKNLLSVLSSAFLISLLPILILAVALSPWIYFFTIQRSGLTISTSGVGFLIACSVLGTVLSAFSALVSSILEGFGKVTLSSSTTTLYNLVALIAVVPAVAFWGPVGIGLANLLGIFVQSLILSSLLVKCYKILPLSSSHDHTTRSLLLAIRKTTFQNFGIVLARMALDPLTRFLVAREASLDMMAFFELALRVTSQARAALLAGLQPLLYIGASDVTNAARRFVRPQQVIVRVACICMVGLNTGAPIVSYLILGQASISFQLLVFILSIGSMCTLVGGPGYFLDVAHGRFDRLFYMTVMMVFINLLVGVPSSEMFGSTGAVSAYSISLVACGYVQLRTFAKASRISSAPFVLSLAFASVISLLTLLLFAFIGRYTDISILNVICISAVLSSVALVIFGLTAKFSALRLPAI